MHIVILGCGRTGATLAADFEDRGHSVAIIDQAADAFRRLPASFQGQRVTGIGFDRQTLVAAGIEEAYGFAAVTDGDNSNIVAARVARETYGVERVVARISDQGRAEVYQRLGIITVAPVPWTRTQIVSNLLPGGKTNLVDDAALGVSMRQVAYVDSWVGQKIDSIEAATQARVAYLARFGKAVLPQSNTVLQDGDLLYLVIPHTLDAQVERTLLTSPGAER